MLSGKENVYTSPDIQNEVIKVMGHQVLRDIATDLQASSFLKVMADETTDSSNHEQVTLILCRVTEELQVHKELIGLYHTASINAETLGASAISSSKHGVSKKISDLEPRAVYTHCYGHAFNLAAGNTLKIMKDALETSREITKLIKYSP